MKVLLRSLGAVLSLTMGAGLMVFALPLAHAGPLPALSRSSPPAWSGWVGWRRKKME